MCYGEGQLQEYIDGQLSQTETEHMARHLKICEKCSIKMELLKKNEELCQLAWGKMLNCSNSTELDLESAWMKIEGRITQKNVKNYGVMKLVLNYKKTAAVAAVALVMATSLSLGPIRAVASDFLKIFRVDKMQTIQIDPRDLSRMQEVISEKGGAVDIRNFGQVESTGTPTSERVTLDQARQSFDFAVRLPQWLPGGFENRYYEKTGGSSVNLTLDADNINKMIASLGGDVLLPGEINGKTIVVSSPPVFSATYESASGDTITLMESRGGPSIGVPQGVDAEKIRSALLSVPALPENLRSQLAAVEDWQHTMLIPSISGSSEEFKVNGNDAIYIDMESASKQLEQQAGHRQKGNTKTLAEPENVLILNRDGVIIVVAGSGLDRQQLVKIASSLN